MRLKLSDGSNGWAAGMIPAVPDGPRGVRHGAVGAAPRGYGRPMTTTRRSPRPRPSLRTLAGRSVAALAVVAALAACGDDDGSEGAGGPTASAEGTEAPATRAPACTDVWVEGDDLPKGYSGCADDEGTLVEPTVVDCSSGQRVVTHDNRWWAVRGHRIGHAPDGLEQSKDYRRVLRSCRA